jgi:hypothetical protein
VTERSIQWTYKEVLVNSWEVTFRYKANASNGNVTQSKQQKGVKEND